MGYWQTAALMSMPNEERAFCIIKTTTELRGEAHFTRRRRFDKSPNSPVSLSLLQPRSLLTPSAHLRRLNSRKTQHLQVISFFSVSCSCASPLGHGMRAKNKICAPRGGHGLVAENPI